LEQAVLAAENAGAMQEPLPDLTVPPLGNAGIRRCYQCRGRFGLVRYRLAQKQFCSKQCMAKYKADNERKLSRIKTWADFFARKM
jgi:hypothetical protein